MNEYDEFLKDDFIMIGNKKGNFRMVKKKEPDVYFDFPLDKYFNIENMMNTSDRLIIYYNKQIKRYIIYIIDKNLTKKPKIIMPFLAKERSSSFELCSLLDTMCLKLRKNKLYVSSVNRDDYNIFSK